MSRFHRLIDRTERLLDRVERLVPNPPEIDWARLHAARWRRYTGAAFLQPIRQPDPVALSTLHGIEPQKTALVRNTRQFLAGLPANNALLWGARGTGKSSLVKALLHEYAGSGLRLVEVDKDALFQLPEIIESVAGHPYRFLLFCDDLSFDPGEAGMRELKAVLDGSLSALPDNMLVYATSNRRHLIPEYLGENEAGSPRGDEIHPGEAVEEKISLSERFGLWLSFYAFDQDAFLDIVAAWLRQLGSEPADWEQCRAEALRYALARGSRSGRVARQFARDYAGRLGLGDA